MNKKNKLVAKYQECPNCGFPFQGHETFCPNCGQKNQRKALSFKNFMNEVFQGFTSWDAKFWRTLFPLLIQPGKVTKDYIEGKRIRYTNPFRFYITTSVIFFLIIGVSQKIENLTHFENVAKQVKKKKKEEELTQQQIDSIKAVVNFSISNPFILKNINEKESEEIKRVQKDTVKPEKTNLLNVSFPKKEFKFGRMKSFSKKHPNLSIDQGLDSLGYRKTFFNRFLYDRVIILNKINESNENFHQYLKSTTSYAAGTLFVLLPVFTLFLSILYIRKKYSYVEHLIFVFHTQTVFFILLSIYFMLSMFFTDGKLWVFISLFLLYLFLAMKKFYKQGNTKTILKFLFLNMTYFILIIFGVVVVMFLSLGLY